MKLILFDLDNTLLDRAAVFRSWAACFARERQLGDGALDRLQAEDCDGKRSREEFFEAVRAAFALRTPAADLITEYRRTYPSGYALAPNTLAALRMLRYQADRRVVIVTNGPATQEEKILRTGLDHVVDGWIISEHSGYRKPDPRIFECAAAKVGCELRQDAWMVGDCPDADVGGAHAAKIRSIWISRGRRWTRESYAPSHVAVTTDEAIAHILEHD